MGRTAFVHVKNPDSNEFEAFGPDDKLPSWATKALKAKGVKLDADDESEDEETPDPGPDPDLGDPAVTGDPGTPAPPAKAPTKKP